MANRKTELTRNETRLVPATKLQLVALYVTIAMLAVSGVLTWGGWMPAWVADTHWVAVLAAVLGLAAAWTIFAALAVRWGR